MQAMNVVFTGPAHTATGKSILRADLIFAAEKRGFAVQKSVRSDTEIVVASRLDTVKARAAAERGVTVMTYPRFLQLLGIDDVPSAGGKPDLFVDMLAKQSAAKKLLPAGDWV